MRAVILPERFCLVLAGQGRRVAVDAAGMEDLIARAQQGDRPSLERLLEQVAPSIERFSRRLCKGGSDHDDVVQDTLIGIATHLGEFEGRSRFSSWVFSLTRSACHRRRRGLKNQPPRGDDELEAREGEGLSPEAEAAQGEIERAVSRAIDALPEEQREVILLRDIEGLSTAEAAESLGLSQEALKSRLHRARAQLREALRPVLEPPIERPTGCPDVASLFSRKLEGELAPADCAAMEQHLLGCPSCSSACHALRTALSACKQTKAETVGPRLKLQIKQALEAFAQHGG